MSCAVTRRESRVPVPSGSNYLGLRVHALCSFWNANFVYGVCIERFSPRRLKSRRLCSVRQAACNGTRLTG